MARASLVLWLWDTLKAEIFLWGWQVSDYESGAQEFCSSLILKVYLASLSLMVQDCPGPSTTLAHLQAGPPEWGPQTRRAPQHSPLTCLSPCGVPGSSTMLLGLLGQVGGSCWGLGVTGSQIRFLLHKMLPAKAG